MYANTTNGVTETSTSKKMSDAVAAASASERAATARFSEAAEAGPCIKPKLGYCVTYEARYLQKAGAYAVKLAG